MMRNLVLAILVLGLGLVGLQAQASANLLSDAGFETQAAGELNYGTTSWDGGGGGGTDSGGGAWIVSGSGEHARTGSKAGKAFIYGSNWAWSVIEQKVFSGSDIIDDSQNYTLSAYLYRDAALGPATARFEVQWLNAGGGDLGSNVVGSDIFSDADASGTWLLKSQQFAPAAGAYGAKYKVVLRSGTTTNPTRAIWVDDGNFDANPIPEPTSMILLGTGILGLFGATRRKN